MGEVALPARCLSLSQSLEKVGSYVNILTTIRVGRMFYHNPTKLCESIDAPTIHVLSKVLTHFRYFSGLVDDLGEGDLKSAPDLLQRRRSILG